jgi:hypothetical protein
MIDIHSWLLSVPNVSEVGWHGREFKGDKKLLIQPEKISTGSVDIFVD